MSRTTVSGTSVSGTTAYPGERRTAGNPRGSPPFGVHAAGRARCQAAEPAFQSAQLMFQPLRPLSGLIVLSGELTTVTTSPMSELS